MSYYTTTVETEELAGSPQENWDENGLTATVQLQCAWAERTTVAAETVGLNQLYPRIPTSKARAKSSACVPFGACSQAASGAVGYEHAMVTVQYVAKDAPEGEDLISESLEPTAEFQTLDYRGFCWSSGSGTPLEKDEAPGRLVRGLDYVHTRHRMTSVSPAVLSLVGYVNAGAMYAPTLGLSFAAQTLLYNPPSLSKKYTTTGSDFTVGTFRFTFKPNGWNTFWRQATQAYEAMYVKGGGVYYNFPLGDFTLLFS